MDALALARAHEGWYVTGVLIFDELAISRSRYAMILWHGLIVGGCSEEIFVLQSV